MDLRRMTTRLVSGFVLLAAAALPIAAATAAAPRSCEALKQWALENGSQLPHDYEGLLAYPLDERRAIYGTMSGEEKAAFWQQKVAAYVESHADLSAVQVAAIQKAASALRPEVYGWQRATVDPLAQVAKDARATLGDRLVEEVFYGLGPADSKLAGSTTSNFSGICDCRNLGDCQQPLYNACGSDGSPCSATTTGCGFGGNQACNRNCILLP